MAEGESTSGNIIFAVNISIRIAPVILNQDAGIIGKWIFYLKVVEAEIAAVL